MRLRRALGAISSFAAIAALLVDARPAEACGCLSPPAVTTGEFAINQRAEQIIFEVEPGWVTAHVLIRYAGDPSQFAWIVPVPEVPEMAISPISAFSLLDRATAPFVQVTEENICPVSEYTCQRAESCGFNDAVGLADAGASSDGAPGGNNPVDVIDEKVVGDYQTVTFRASEAAAATQWLRDNGFVVNSTTSIYMESYVQANMVFVAVKLVPGAGVSSIKPLKMKYRAAFPQVPLILTAVAAEPHLTVTSFIYGAKPFKPQGHPVVTIDPNRIAKDSTGRFNYPMVMARTVDEAGGDGFVIEYAGQSPRVQQDNNNYCCSNPELDLCQLANNDQCDCPRNAWDSEDCGASGDIVEGIELLDALATKYPVVSRITTRISAEEMTFDPAYEPDFNGAATGRLTLSTTEPVLTSCTAQIMDQDAFAEIQTTVGCTAMYCGAGQCVTTEAGAGCACDAGYVAQRFTDADGLPSVTCVPQTPPCDLRAGGDNLPDGCATASCGAGACIDRNGVPVCLCNSGAAAVAGNADAPSCAAIVKNTNSPGAQDYSEQLRDLDVCAPAPPSCGDNGWLVKGESPRPGVTCANSRPNPSDMIPRLGESCGGFGCGGCAAPNAGGIGAIVGGVWIFFALVFVRRRRSR
jgi:hypothetical protein